MTSILVFDSGVGGLSILRAIQAHPKITPEHYQWLFCSDNAFFPYGTKDADVLIARIISVLSALCEKYQPDMIVMACNTASTIALDAVRKIISVPIVGVVPAIKPAAQLSRSRTIGLLATPGTVSRPYTQQLIDEFASDCTVMRVGSTELVEMIEAYWRTNDIDEQQLAVILEPFRVARHAHNLDTIVLACTHFPLIIDLLKKQLPDIPHWVDSGIAIANRVVWHLEQVAANHQPVKAENLALFTQLDETVDSLQTFLSDFGIHRIAGITINNQVAVDNQVAICTR